VSTDEGADGGLARGGRADRPDLCRQPLVEAGIGAQGRLNKRGLSDGTIRSWDLGYNPEGQEIAGRWVEEGITIPWWADGKVWHVNVRRAGKEPDPKYKAVSGGRPILFGADRLAGEDLVLVEGEFDCVLLKQDAGDLVAVATLGGCDKGIGGPCRSGSTAVQAHLGGVRQ